MVQEKRCICFASAGTPWLAATSSENAAIDFINMMLPPCRVSTDSSENDRNGRKIRGSVADGECPARHRRLRLRRQHLRQPPRRQRRRWGQLSGLLRTHLPARLARYLARIRFEEGPAR